MVWAVVWTLSPGSVPAALLTCGPWSNALVSLNVGFLVCGMPGSWRGLCSPWSSSSVLFPTLLFNQCLWDLLVSGQSAGSRGGKRSPNHGAAGEGNRVPRAGLGAGQRGPHRRPSALLGNDFSFFDHTS